MQFTFEIDLQAIVAKTMAPENIAPVLEAAISKAFKTAVDQATGYSSELTKSMTEQLKAALPHGLDIDEVAKFQFLMNQAITSAVHGANSETIRVAMAGAVKSVMPDVPMRIKLSELVEKARDGFHKEKHEEFFAEYEPSTYGGGHLYLNRSTDCRSVYSASHRLAFNEAGEVYTMRMDGHDILPSKLPQAISHFEGLLLALYVGRSTIDVDIDEDDVKSAAQASYDD
jgi:hypothetical protein